MSVGFENLHKFMHDKIGKPVKKLTFDRDIFSQSTSSPLVFSEQSPLRRSLACEGAEFGFCCSVKGHNATRQSISNPRFPIDKVEKVTIMRSSTISRRFRNFTAIVVKELERGIMSPTDDFDIIPKRTSKGKAVRFADNEGLRLCEVFHIHYHDDDYNGKRRKYLRTEAKAKPKPLQVVNLPWTQDVLDQRLKRTSVALENVVKTEKGIIGITAVKNVAYHKDVIVRYSFNEWKTVNETTATFYKQDSSHQVDYFVFVVTRKMAHIDTNWTINFAICYKVNGQEHWDNNNGENYHISS